MMEKHFNKELVINKVDDENFESTAKCYCHITGKYRGAETVTLMSV